MHIFRVNESLIFCVDNQLNSNGKFIIQLLLIEDDIMLGEAICDGARQSGWDIVHVRDAELGRAALIDHSFSTVLLDLGLPGDSGLSVLRLMRTR